MYCFWWMFTMYVWEGGPNSVTHKWGHEKFIPPCDSDKQTIAWVSSLRVTYGTTALVSSVTRYLAINFAIWWPLQLKMSEKTHGMYLGIIIIHLGHLESILHYPWQQCLFSNNFFKLIKHLDHQSFFFCLNFLVYKTTRSYKTFYRTNSCLSHVGVSGDVA